MSSDGQDDRIRALLREAHRGDEPRPPFEKLVRAARSRGHAPRRAWALPAAALATVASLGVALLLVRGEQPRSTQAWSSGIPEGPLDFLLELPRPAPLEAFPSLRAPSQTNRR